MQTLLEALTQLDDAIGTQQEDTLIESLVAQLNAKNQIKIDNVQADLQFAEQDY